MLQSGEEKELRVQADSGRQQPAVVLLVANSTQAIKEKKVSGGDALLQNSAHRGFVRNSS